MKKQVVYLLAALAVSATIISCKKENFDEMSSSTSVKLKARAIVETFPQTETFYNSCCGEEVTINYNVVVASTAANGWNVSLSQLNGVGATTGNIYRGGNAQGVHGNTSATNFTYHFSTLITSQGCSFRLFEVYHLTFDGNGNLILERDQYSLECI